MGVDIGGSGVRAAIVEAGSVGITRQESLSDRSVATVVETLARAVGPLCPDAVGIGVPGYVHRGRVLGSPNFPDWTDIPFADLAAARLGVPVTLENDANAAALGAWRSRGGREDLVLLTLGTGVGGGVVVDGRLLRGAGGTGAELGHIYAGGDLTCGCGGVGCLETWCGTSGLTRRADARGHHVPDGRAIVEAAARGEAWAADLLHAAGTGLGRGLVTLVNVFNPDVVVITGGLASARRWLVKPAEDWLRAHGIRPCVARATLVWEGRADHFAILGAAEVASGR